MIMRLVNIFYYIGAALLFFGLVSRFFMQQYYSYIYVCGAVLFAVMQLLSRPRGEGVALRRLVVQQQLAGILFIAAGVLMFTHVRNEWMVAVTCAAMVELYTAYRIPQEIEKSKK